MFYISLLIVVRRMIAAVVGSEASYIFQTGYIAQSSIVNHAIAGFCINCITHIITNCRSVHMKAKLVDSQNDGLQYGIAMYSPL